MVLPIAIGYTMAAAYWPVRGRLRKIIAYDQQNQSIFLGIILVTIMMALVFSQSRAGIMSGMVAVLVFFVISRIVVKRKAGFAYFLMGMIMVLFGVYALAMEVFRFSKNWPPEERFSLTDQIRRSSRSVCSNLREAWAKRRYEAHFISKLTDVDGENSETDTWLDFAHDCGYVSKDEHERLVADCREVGAMLGSMLKNPVPFLIKAD